MAWSNRDNLPQRLREDAGRICEIRACGRGVDGFGPWCSRHRSILAYHGVPLSEATPAVRYRRLLIKLVLEAMGDKPLPEQLVRYFDRVKGRLLIWAGDLDAKGSRRQAQRLAEVDTRLFLAALVAYRLHENEYRNLRHLVRQLPAGWFGKDQEDRFNGAQLARWVPLRTEANAEHLGLNQVCSLLLRFRFSPNLTQVADTMISMVAPRVRQGIVDARRETAAAERAKAERAIQKYRPHGTNPDGTFDIFRHEQHPHGVETDE